MAAALRLAARTLRTTSSQCPRHAQRLVHGGPSAAVSDANDGKRLFDTRILDEKKKELHGLLDEIRRNKNCILRRRDRQLLQQLSGITKLREIAYIFMTTSMKLGLVFCLGYKAQQWKASSGQDPVVSSS